MGSGQSTSTNNYTCDSDLCKKYIKDVSQLAKLDKLKKDYQLSFKDIKNERLKVVDVTTNENINNEYDFIVKKTNIKSKKVKYIYFKIIKKPPLNFDDYTEQKTGGNLDKKSTKQSEQKSKQKSKQNLEQSSDDNSEQSSEQSLKRNSEQNSEQNKINETEEE
jgi:hypothetical protein